MATTEASTSAASAAVGATLQSIPDLSAIGPDQLANILRDMPEMIKGVRPLPSSVAQPSLTRVGSLSSHSSPPISARG
jgi:hypothetical protein